MPVFSVHSLNLLRSTHTAVYSFPAVHVTFGSAGQGLFSRAGIISGASLGRSRTGYHRNGCIGRPPGRRRRPTF